MDIIVDNKIIPEKSSLYCIIFLFILITQFFPTNVGIAVEIDKSGVKSAVQTWLHFETADANQELIIESIDPWYVDGVVTGYIAHIQGGGFCICGADTLVLPVYFYSPEGTFNPDSEDYRFIFWEINARKQYLESMLQQKNATPLLSTRTALTDREAYWQKLIAGQPVQRLQSKDVEAAPTTMILHLTTSWHQRSPYNDLCPNLTPGQDEHVVVGCVATSTAQVMNYWKWPNTGVGTGSNDYSYRWRSDWDETSLSANPKPELGDTYWSWGGGRLEWTSTGGGILRMTGYWDQSVYLAAVRINENDTDFRTALDFLWNRLSLDSKPNTANFGTTNYNWSILPDTAADPPDAGALEAAKLSYQLGIALKMNWGLWLSTTSTNAAVTALEDHFRYDDDAFTSAASANMLIEEIQWLRPAFLDGCRSSGGCHSWLVVGYNLGIAPDHQFYINLGWGGGNAGWYTLDSMEFNLNQSQATQVAPENVKFVGAADAGDGSPNDPYRDIDEANAEAADNSILIFQAGSINSFAGGSLVLNRPMTLKGYNATIK
jgi:hypothetical protein